MFSWFKRREIPATGPDYQHVDSRAKAEDLCRRGELQKLLLLPLEFGGEDIPPNVVYVPVFAAELKARLDQNTIAPLAQKGQVTRYTATPVYEGRSVIPSQILVSATDPGSFQGTIAIWGEAVQNESRTRPKPASNARALARPAFTVDATAVEGLGPEGLVCAFIADYEAWNQYANEIYAFDPGKGMAAADAAYATLSRKFCQPGQEHQPIAFGSDPLHDSAHEVIVGVDFEGDTRLVRTRHTKIVGTLTMTDDYEYRLKKADGRWFLTSILYVDEDGKYEGL